MNRLPVIAFTLALSAYSLTIACRRVQSPQANINHAEANGQKHEADNLIAVFSSFHYVGEGTYIPKSVPAHTMDTRSLPANFETRLQYVFHSKDSDNDRHFTEIQETLRSKGFTILGADKLAYRNIGGLLFRIRFSSPTHQFLFYNEPDLQILKNAELSKAWSVDDYILSIEAHA